METDPHRLDRGQGLEYLPIELADGQCWDFPVPASFSTGTRERYLSASSDPSHLLGENYLPLIRMVAEAENASERSRAELALAIHLFQRLHNLPPSALQQLFTFPPGSPELASSRADFHDLARLHLRAFYPSFSPSPRHLPAPCLAPFALLGRLLRFRISPIPLQLLGRSRP